MRATLLVLIVLFACKSAPPGPPPQAVKPAAPALRAVESFASIGDEHARSAALFLEASRVFTHPRCLDCHPDGDTPAQGTPDKPHDPPVVRGADDKGVVGMRCSSCHQDHNLELSRVPGAPDWHLAPKAMAWVNRSPRQICEQMKDPRRNGGKTLRQIADHNAHDKLVAWGWSPGHDREPAPGTQAQLGALIAEWVKTGAECPKEGERL